MRQRGSEGARREGQRRADSFLVLNKQPNKHFLYLTNSKHLTKQTANILLNKQKTFNKHFLYLTNSLSPTDLHPLPSYPSSQTPSLSRSRAPSPSQTTTTCFPPRMSSSSPPTPLMCAPSYRSLVSSQPLFPLNSFPISISASLRTCFLASLPSLSFSFSR